MSTDGCNAAVSPLGRSRGKRRIWAMGLLVDGVGRDQWYDTRSTGGRFAPSGQRGLDLRRRRGLDRRRGQRRLEPVRGSTCSPIRPIRRTRPAGGAARALPLSGGRPTDRGRRRLFTTLVRFDAVYVGHFSCPGSDDEESGFRTHICALDDWRPVCTEN